MYASWIRRRAPPRRAPRLGSTGRKLPVRQLRDLRMLPPALLVSPRDVPGSRCGCWRARAALAVCRRRRRLGVRVAIRCRRRRTRSCSAAGSCSAPSLHGQGQAIVVLVVIMSLGEVYVVNLRPYQDSTASCRSSSRPPLVHHYADAISSEYRLPWRCTVRRTRSFHASTDT